MAKLDIAAAELVASVMPQDTVFVEVGGSVRRITVADLARAIAAAAD